jgi:hypothetical protein
MVTEEMAQKAAQAKNEAPAPSDTNTAAINALTTRVAKVESDHAALTTKLSANFKGKL